MKERLQKILSGRGVASRRKAEEWIAAGRVQVNGKVALLGDCADEETDEILLDGKKLPSAQASVYIMLNKPRGYVTTLSDEKGRKTVTELVADCGVRVYPVGRLDMDSEGLLLLTNDGDFANRMMHPRHEVGKTYVVSVKGYHPQALSLLEGPMELDGYQLSKPLVKLISQDGERAKIQITIHEGRNRQVRRMCDLAGMTVLRLCRISEGTLKLSDLPVGKWRYLTQDELAEL
ncbi:MAG: rRNA pseudouridine synthase [Ruminococcaceae bacterium]|nr:rRNA pseudouridine synthase [Oscillospiraceae bacterium]